MNLKTIGPALPPSGGKKETVSGKRVCFNFVILMTKL